MSDDSKPIVLSAFHSWIDKEFFQKALQGDNGDSTLVVKDFLLGLGCNKGDNYGGVMYKAAVTTEEDGVEKKYSLFLKCLPDNEYRVKMFGDLKLTLKESNFYNVAIPKANWFLKKHSSGLNISDNFPKCYYANVGGAKDVFVMENLRDDGYKMANRKLGFDYDHCQLVMRGLAKFHASWFAMKIKEPEAFQKMPQFFRETAYAEENRELMTSFVVMSFQSMAKTVKEIPGCEHLSGKIEVLKDKAFNIAEELVKPKEPTAVICLGDCWVNNMMFKYRSNGEGKEVPDNIKFLDFQMARYTSPAIDLVYLIYTSTTAEIRKKYLDELLQLYHSSFTDVLKAVDVDPTLFSFEMLQKEWKEHLMYGLITGAMVLGAVSANAEDIPEFDSMTEEEFKNMDPELLKFVNNPTYFKKLGDMLKEYESYGLLD